MQKEVEAMEDVVAMVFDFSKINRATMAPDGSFESDTDHTVMMSVIACAIADKLYKDLDIGIVAQFAITHDLLEIYTGDVDTFKHASDDALLNNKKELAKGALEKMQVRFENVYPWISETITKYEALDTKEARFVKTLDKIIPKVTNILNKGIYFRAHNLSREEVKDLKDMQVKKIRESYGAEFPELISIFETLNKKVLETCF